MLGLACHAEANAEGEHRRNSRYVVNERLSWHCQHRIWKTTGPSFITLRSPGIAGTNGRYVLSRVDGQLYVRMQRQNDTTSVRIAAECPDDPSMATIK